MGSATLELAWESTPLGAMSTWGESLRQTARMCFSTKFPVMIAWGPDLTMIFNDAYRDMLGTHKRLAALGAPLATVWEEVWGGLGATVEQVMTTRLPTWATDEQLMVNRSGFVEETFFTCSYSPLLDDWGEVAGILGIATETTTQVVTQRRLALVDSLYAELQRTPSDPATIAQTAIDLLTASTDLARCSIVLRTPAAPGTVVTGDPALARETGADVLDPVLSSRVVTVAGSVIVAPLSSTDHGDADGALILDVAPTRPFDAALRGFALLIAAALSGALRAATLQRIEVDFLDARAQVLELEHAKARETSIALQHSLFTAPPEPDHLHLVVRYQPAARDLEIGGDWYDAFLTKDGATTLVIGDVTGHDYHAAAAMGQLRGLIRAIAYDSGHPPATVLERTDEAIAGLNLGSSATATAIMARLEQDPVGRLDGVRTVRWTNAGHPHPLLLRADGTIEILDRRNDPLLGVLAGTPRTEHSVNMHPKDTLFLYTDGLTERRGVPWTTSTAALVDALRGGHTKTLDELADHVLATLAPSEAADDVALVLVRPYPENRPRPPEAGPGSDVPGPII